MLFVSYHFFATYHDGSPHRDFGNIFIEAETPKSEEDIYYLESKIQKNIKMRIGFDSSVVTIINFKEV